MKDGEQIGYFNSGEIEYKCWYLDGKINGEYIYYYRIGERNGEQIGYFNSGEISFKYYYINDKLVSEFEWISYNRNTKLELLGL